MGVACRKTFCRPVFSASRFLRAESALSPAASTFDPEHGVAIVGLQGEGKLHLQFLGAPHKVEDFFRLLRQGFEFAREPRESLIEGKELVSVFFQKFAAGLEGKASIARRKQREEKLRLLPQTAQRSGKRCGKHAVMLHRGFDVARQVVYAQVADGDPEVVSGYVFEFVSFRQKSRPRLRAGCRRRARPRLAT